MAKPTLPLLLLAISTILTISLPRTTSTAAPTAAADFIKSSCAATTYPTLCVQSLTPYAPKIRHSPRRLASTALAVSLTTARSAESYVHKMSRAGGLKPREAAAMKDCAEEIGDTVDRLSRSIEELKGMNGKGGGGGGSGRAGFQWHLSNIETWVSAALTDENTCLDGFGGKAMDGKTKDGIRARFMGVARVTSNALALINKFAHDH